MSNLKGTLNDTSKNDAREAKQAFNSIDFLVHATRMPVFRSNAQGIYLYGTDNNYPYKVKQISKRSNSLITACNTYSEFLQGLSFEGARVEDILNGNAVVINKKGQTAYDLLKFAASEKANINFAVHINFNALGEAVEFTPVPYELVRVKCLDKDDLFERMIVTNIWHIENDLRQQGFYTAYTIQNFQKWVDEKKRNYNFSGIECFAYNPDPLVVREQIKMSGGIENYPGQIFYANDSYNVYQEAMFDSVLDDAQTEAESKLYSLSNLQNGFSGGGVLKYPSNLDSNEEFISAKKKLQNITGSINSGRFITVPYLPGQPPASNFFEPIQTANIDSLFTNQKEEAKRNIYELYRQSGIINGRSDNGMFNQQSMVDAFDFYNSRTKQARQKLEIELTTLFSNSIIDIPLPIEIEPLRYETSSQNLNGNNEEAEQERRQAQAKLKGTVGGVDGILSIQEKVSMGITQYDSGLEILKEIYGFEEDKAVKILGKPVKEFSENEETVSE